MQIEKNKYEILQTVFGYPSFREGQEQIVDALIQGRDVLCVMPTGAGKSICYQVPALATEGITLVVSPLISLMKDQVTALCQSGVAAAYLNSSLSFAQSRKVMERLAQGQYKLIYVAPERLMADRFIEVAKTLPIRLLAVDEAHCVSQWGQDFRPAYLNIMAFLKELPIRPVVGAFTATATAEVKKDIHRLLGLQEPLAVNTGFDRPNLRFSVCKPKDRKRAVEDYVTQHRDKSGIVYCSTRKNVEEVCAMLQEAGIAATRYHAGLEDEERQHNQENFLKDISPVMVATNAFGMGIDKSNVSYVVHYNMPKNLENYYQEAGRAGRDGQKAECILFYAPMDVRTNRFFIDNSEPPEDMTEDEIHAFREKEYQRLKYMTFYCTTDQCLRSFILTYFGDKSGDFCGNCSSCDGGVTEKDVTIDTQKVLSCIARCKESYGAALILDVLRGSKGERICSLGFDQLSTHGIMKEWSEKDLRNFISRLMQREIIATTEGEYPVLQLNEASWKVLKGQQKVTMRIQDTPHREESQTKRKIAPADPLFVHLKAVRMEQAKKENVPAYVIFTDATLMDMCQKQPKTMEAMLSVSGVGYAKQEKYGAIFLKALRDFESREL